MSVWGKGEGGTVKNERKIDKARDATEAARKLGYFEELASLQRTLNMPTYQQSVVSCMHEASTCFGHKFGIGVDCLA